jgi:hypothetical protein
MITGLAESQPHHGHRAGLAELNQLPGKRHPPKAATLG